VILCSVSSLVDEEEEEEEIEDERLVTLAVLALRSLPDGDLLPDEERIQSAVWSFLEFMTALGVDVWRVVHEK